MTEAVDYFSERIENLSSQLAPFDRKLRQAKILERRATCLRKKRVYDPQDRKWERKSRPCNNPRDPDCPAECQEEWVSDYAYGLRNLRGWYSGYRPLLMALIPNPGGQTQNTDTVYWDRHNLLYKQFPLIAEMRLLILNGRDPRIPQLQEVTVEEIISLLPLIASNLAFHRHISGNLFSPRPRSKREPPKGCVSIRTKSVSADVPEGVMDQACEEAAKAQTQDPRDTADAERISQEVANRLVALLLLAGAKGISVGWTRIWVRNPLISKERFNEIMTQSLARPLVQGLSP